MNVIPAVQTPMPRDHVAGAFVEGARMLGLDLPDGAFACVMAKTALETGRWGPHVGKDGKKRGSMWCYEFGNIKASKAWKDAGEPVQMYRCNEQINGVYQWFDPPHIQTHFRAHRDPATGACHYLKFVKERYAAAWNRALADDPRGFVVELKNKGYFTADLEPYVRAVISMHAEFTPFVKTWRGTKLPVEIPPAEPTVGELDELEELRKFLVPQLEVDYQTIVLDSVNESVRQGRREMSGLE
jgi:hypothetical protein